MSKGDDDDVSTIIVPSDRYFLRRSRRSCQLTRSECLRDALSYDDFPDYLALREHSHNHIAVLERLSAAVRSSCVLPFFRRFLNLLCVEIVYHDIEAVLWEVRSHREPSIAEPNITNRLHGSRWFRCSHLDAARGTDLAPGTQR